MSPKDSSAAAASARESNHAEFALLRALSDRGTTTPATAVLMIGFTR